MDPATILVGTGERFDKSPAHLGADCSKYTCTQLYTALAHRWSTDQFLTLYQVWHENGTLAYWPRLNMANVREIRERNCHVYQVGIALDFDLPGKRTWEGDEPDQMYQRLMSYAGQEWSVPADWTACYTTEHGFRLIYALSHTLRPESVNAKIAGLIRDFQVVGLNFDEACKDWTRLFRLPCVTRDGLPTWTQHYFRFWWQNKTLNPDTIADGEVERRFNAVSYGILDEQMPTPEESRDRLYMASPSTGQDIQTPWYREARRRLQGREVLKYIDGNFSLVQGTRNNSLAKLIGQACSVLIEVPEVSAPNIFALIDDQVQQLSTESGELEWRHTAWGMVCRFLGQELAQLNDRKALAAQAQAAKDGELVDVQNSMVHGLREWCQEEEIHQDEHAALEWARQHAIVCAKNYYVLKPNGHYDSMGVSLTHLPARIRALGMDLFIPTREPTVSGGMKDVTPGALVNRHGTIVSQIEGAVDVPETQLINPGTSEAKLVFRMYQRKTDLKPAWSRHVEQWLRSWCMVDEDYERLTAWIGHALNFEGGPICALSLSGPPGAGKKLLAQGLAEAITTERFATGAEFETNYGSALLRTGFVVLNEGLPSNVRNFADIFRRMVGGDPIEINPKYQDPVVVRNPVRMILMANNLESVVGLVGQQELTEEDQKALVQRILHLNISPRAADYLTGLGGLAYTGAEHARWIRGDAGAASDYIVARHFLYLYENRPAVPKGARMLVEGAMDGDLVRLMSLRSGDTSVVVEALVRLIERNTSSTGILIDHHLRMVKVSSAIVLDYIHDHLYTRMRGTIHIRAIANALKTLAVGPQEKVAGHGRMYTLNLRKLYDESVDHGYKCSVLFGLVSGVTAATTQQAKVVFPPPNNAG